MLIANLSVRTPRRINQLCASIVGKAVSEGILRSPGEDVITKEIVKKEVDELMEFDVR